MVAAKGSLQGEAGVNVFDLRDRIANLENGAASESKGLAEAQERISALSDRVQQLEVDLHSVKERIKASVDLTDDLVDTANNVLTHTDSLLTTYFFAITIGVSFLVLVLQWWFNRTRKQHIASLKEEHEGDLRELRLDHDRQMAEQIQLHNKEMHDQVEKVEQTFIDRLNRDEAFLDSLTGPILQNKKFIDTLIKTASGMSQGSEDQVADEEKNETDILALGDSIDKQS